MSDILSGGKINLASLRDVGSTGGTLATVTAPDNDGILRIWIQSQTAAELNVTETDTGESPDSRVLHPGEFPADRLWPLEMPAKAGRSYAFAPSATINLEALEIDFLNL